MKKKWIAALPFLTMPVFTPLYAIVDKLILLDIFGCGCVPITQTNRLNIPYNANDLRLTVFSFLTILLSVWAIRICKTFQRKSIKIVYCLAVIAANVCLTLWVIQTFMWA